MDINVVDDMDVVFTSGKVAQVHLQIDYNFFFFNFSNFEKRMTNLQIPCILACKMHITDEDDITKNFNVVFWNLRTD